MGTPNFTAAKAQLRRIYLAKREAVPPEQRMLEASAVAAAFFDHPLMADRTPGTVLVPTQHGAELDTRPLAQALVAHGWTLLRPRSRTDASDLDAIIWPLRAKLTPGRWGVLEPPADAGHIGLDKVDLVIVPGVAFDARGGRLGMGSGVFDRYLSRLSAAHAEVPTIGVGYGFQLVDAVPQEPHDVALQGLQLGARGWVCAR